MYCTMSIKIQAGGGGCIPTVYARVSLGLGLARSCNNESDWLFPVEESERSGNEMFV